MAMAVSAIERLSAESNVLSDSRRTQMYTVYILRNSKNRLYIGQTSKLDGRLMRHTSDGALFVRNDLTYRLIYFENFRTQLEAMSREKQLKGWTRVKKEALIAKDFELLKKL
jgi:putative endonuclease